MWSGQPGYTILRGALARNFYKRLFVISESCFFYFCGDTFKKLKEFRATIYKFVLSITATTVATPLPFHKWELCNDAYKLRQTINTVLGSIGSFHDKSHKKMFNHYLSDFDDNWYMGLSYSQNLLVKILGFYD